MGVNCAYAKEAIDTFTQVVPMDTVEEWHQDGENLDKIMAIDPDELKNIPYANYL
jgi:hypothetical protein